ncbi:MAG: CAP domain-containing protein [Actinomycetota bacterium]
MHNESTDHGSGLYDAPTRPIPMHRTPSLLGDAPPEPVAPVFDHRQPHENQISMFDRVESRTIGLLGSMVLGGLLLIVVALVLLGGGEDSSTETAGLGVAAAPVGQAPESSATDGAAAGQLTSTTALPSTVTTVPLTSSTTLTSTTLPPTTAAPATTAAPTTTAPPTTASTTTEPPTTSSSTTTEATSTTEPDPSTTVDPSTTMPSSDEPTTTTDPSVANDPTTTAPPTTAGPSGDDAAIQQQVLDATNAERAANGCGPLSMDPLLNRAADGHSEDMAARGYFSHTDPEDRGPGFRIDAVGYSHRGWAENIAAGYGSAEAVVRGWMNSTGHRANILNCAYDEIGIGYAEPGRYWTQLFATSN